MALLPFWIFMGLLLLGMPVVFALLLGPGMSLWLDGRPDAFFGMMQQRLFNGLRSFPLMAVPFFILAGELMNRGNITVQLVEFSKSLIGHVRGGLAQVNILTSILFAGLSGSAVADTSALGSMLIPAMEKNGYSRRFAAAITAASSVIGPIIPPSGIMILYAFIMNVSVAGLFAAGIVPGLLVGLGLMLMTSYLSKRYDFPVASRKATWRERGTALKIAFWPLLTPVILLGGILTGIFTPTEAAVVGATDATTGQAIIAYVILRGGEDVDEQVLRAHVADEIGAIAKPKQIFITPGLPKTRSGKIMRRLLRDVAEGRNIGDTTTLADASIVDELQAKAAASADD